MCDVLGGEITKQLPNTTVGGELCSPPRHSQNAPTEKMICSQQRATPTDFQSLSGNFYVKSYVLYPNCVIAFCN